MRRSRLPQVVAFAAVAMAIVATAVVWHSKPSSAAVVTHTVTFTARGPSPATISLKDGDRIEFRNAVDPAAAVPLLGTVTGLLSTVDVQISGATQTPFQLSPGQSVVVGPYRGGAHGEQVHYVDTYSSTFLVGLVPGPSKSGHGQIAVGSGAS